VRKQWRIGVIKSSESAQTVLDTKLLRFVTVEFVETESVELFDKENFGETCSILKDEDIKLGMHYVDKNASQIPSVSTQYGKKRLLEEFSSSFLQTHPAVRLLSHSQRDEGLDEGRDRCYTNSDFSAIHSQQQFNHLESTGLTIPEGPTLSAYDKSLVDKYILSHSQSSATTMRDERRGVGNTNATSSGRGLGKLRTKPTSIQSDMTTCFHLRHRLFSRLKLNSRYFDVIFEVHLG
jgi:hypothetical protein